MSDRTHSPVDHPDELLAGYVDGSATPSERAAVEAHLSSCAQCLEEIELASAGRGALASLPDLEPPGLAAEGLAAFRRAGFEAIPGGDHRDGQPPAPVEEPSRSRPKRRMSWVPALAAAAILVIAGVVALPILLQRGSERASAPEKAGAARPTASPLPQLIDRGATYTPATLNGLAQSLVPLARDAAGGASAPTSAPTRLLFGTPGLAPSPGHVAADQAEYAASQSALGCLRQGGGLESDAVPVYLEAATVNGVPAYVGAFIRKDARLNFVVVAVGRTGCQPLYTASQSA